MVDLRPYQVEAVASIYKYFAERRGEAPLVVAPTGSGKSLILSEFMRQAAQDYPGTRILLATHQKELIEQDYKALLRIWPEAPAGIYSAGMGKRQARAQMLFAGVQSVHRKAREIGHVDLMGVDEAHLMPRSANTQYRRLVDGLLEINPRLKLFGLTATPYRLDSGLLHEGEGAVFDGIAYDIPVDMLVEKGYLAPLISKKPGTVYDLTGLHKRGGDYIESEMEDRFADEETIRAVCAEIVAAGQNRRSWIAFCISVRHASLVRDELRHHGIVAEAITGDTPSGDRTRIIREYREGRIRALTSVNVLSTGFDAPATDLIAMLRPTASTGLYIQQAGRGMRLKPQGGDCLVLDFALNVSRHGPVDGIEPPRKKAKEGDGEAPTKVCPQCSSIILIASRECPDCGHIFPEPEVKIEKTASTEAIMNLTSKDNWESVLDVSYSRHRKAGSPDSLRVDYLVGQNRRVVSEWVCLEHSGFARQKAVLWWARHAGTSAPNTVDDALEQIEDLRPPAEAIIIREGKYYHVSRVRFQAVECAS